MKHALLLSVTVLAAGCAAPQAPDLAPVPEALRPGADEKLALVAHAKGEQIYECRQTPGPEYAFDWAFVAPVAELFDGNGKKIGSHYAGPHWEAADGSRIAGKVAKRADAPAEGAIPWLLLETTSVGRNGAFSRITSVQRVATAGGVAPPHGCPYAGLRVEIPYTADYYLFTKK